MVLTVPKNQTDKRLCSVFLQWVDLTKLGVARQNNFACKHPSNKFSASTLHVFCLENIEWRLQLCTTCSIEYVADTGFNPLMV